MKLKLKLFSMILVLIFLATVWGCGPEKTAPVKTEPTPEPVKEPTVEELRTPVAKDASIYKAHKVIREFGRLSKRYMSYEKYQKMTGGQAGATLDPDWFYDSYILDLNQDGYWATVTFGTSKRAMQRDPRIQKVMENLPPHAITVKLKTPSGREFVLHDQEADGVLDFVRNTREKPGTKINIQLLDKMQKKYTWLLGLVKKHYKK